MRAQHVTTGCQPGTPSTGDREMPIASSGLRAGIFLWSAPHQADQESVGLDLLIGTVTAREPGSSSSRLYYFAKG